MVEGAHLTVSPLQLINKVQAAMEDERVHLPCLLAEASNTIATLFGGAELEFKEWLVLGAYYAEVVGHCRLV